MMADKSGVRVEGLKELQRAFAVASKEMTQDLRAGLESAAEPVRAEAEQRAGLVISGVRRSEIPWQEMRVGVTRGSVYVAPKRRRTVGTRRPNFAGLLLTEAMEPALEANIDRVEGEVIDAINDMMRAWERVG